MATTHFACCCQSEPAGCWLSFQICATEDGSGEPEWVQAKNNCVACPDCKRCGGRATVTVSDVLEVELQSEGKVFGIVGTMRYDRRALQRCFWSPSSHQPALRGYVDGSRVPVQMKGWLQCKPHQTDRCGYQDQDEYWGLYCEFTMGLGYTWGLKYEGGLATPETVCPPGTFIPCLASLTSGFVFVGTPDPVTIEQTPPIGII